VSNPQKNNIDAIFDRVIDIMAVAGGVLLVIIFIMINTDVALRYFFRSPLGWTTELSTYMLLFITFLIAPWVLKTEGHVSIDFVIQLLGVRKRALANMITSFLCAIVCLILTWYGGKVTFDLYVSHYFTPTLLQVPKFAIIGIISIGSFVFFLQFLRRINHFFRIYKGEPEKKLNVSDKAEAA
jgi:TRAP-type C4-dicarboxylate transport system permease small subunit